MTEFLLSRPILASTVTILMLILGAVAIPGMPISQYPSIFPTTITISANYPGADSQAIESSVTTPIEHAVNAIHGLKSLSSISSSDGYSQITCTFNVETNLDVAASDVQNAVAQLQSVLPAPVVQNGVEVSKTYGATVINVAFYSVHHKRSLEDISHLVDVNVLAGLRQIDGVSGAKLVDDRRVAMRIWLHPSALAQRGLTVEDVLMALQEQNVEIGGGSFGGQPTNGSQSYEYGLQTDGRLHTPDEFASIVLRSEPNGSYIYLRDVAQIVEGAEDYSNSLIFNGHPAIGVVVQQDHEGNALLISDQVREIVEKQSKLFPPDMRYAFGYDRAAFVRQIIHEELLTLVFSVLLVILVMLFAFADWRISLIPAITIPASIAGTIFVMRDFGYSINTLTLFGLTLATGLVVDDAVVVVESIVAHKRRSMSSRDAARAAMHDITGAVIASSLTLLAVFVPIAFLPGVTGVLYRQFGLTISCAVLLSLITALTMSPVITAQVLRKDRPVLKVFQRASSAFVVAQRLYNVTLRSLLSRIEIVIAVLAITVPVTFWLLLSNPSGFLTKEDQGLFYVDMECPPNYSADRTFARLQVIENLVRQQPEVKTVSLYTGQSLSDTGSNLGFLNVSLTDWSTRKGESHSVAAIIKRLNSLFPKIDAVSSFAVAPADVPGLGRQGGLSFELEDRAAGSLKRFDFITQRFVAKLQERGSLLANVDADSRDDRPVYKVEVNRRKALDLGVALPSIYDTLSVQLGSEYVNDFDVNGQSFRVYVQSDANSRSNVTDLEHMYVHSQQVSAQFDNINSMIPISTLVTLVPTLAPHAVSHFNGFRSVAISAEPADRVGSGQAIEYVEKAAADLPLGYGISWVGLSREETEDGAKRIIIFVLAFIVVFIILLVQYESLTASLVIIASVPTAILGGVAAVRLSHGVSNIYAQLGYILLLGLATKNAILIVDRANRLRKLGYLLIDSIVEAATERFRPIVITTVAFAAGIVPLTSWEGVGSNARHSLGLVVLVGIVVSSVLNLIFTPTLYVMVVNLTIYWRTTSTPLIQKDADAR